MIENMSVNDHMQVAEQWVHRIVRRQGCDT